MAGKKPYRRKKYNMFVKIVAIVCAALMIGSVLLAAVTSL